MIGRHLRGQAGTVDLPSVVISVLVTALLTVGSIFAVDAIVPWQQDRGAKSSLAAVAPAQRSALNATGSFKTLDALVSEGWLESRPQGVQVALGNEERCFTSVGVSGSGKVLLDEGEGAVELGGAAYTSKCLTTAQVRALVSSAGGPPSWNLVQGVLPAPTGLAYNKLTGVISWEALAGAQGYQVEVQCGSSLSSTPVHHVHVPHSATTSTLPASACASGSPMLINVWATNSLDGDKFSLVAGLGTTR